MADREEHEEREKSEDEEAEQPQRHADGREDGREDDREELPQSQVVLVQPPPPTSVQKPRTFLTADTLWTCPVLERDNPSENFFPPNVQNPVCWRRVEVGDNHYSYVCSSSKTMTNFATNEKFHVLVLLCKGPSQQTQTQTPVQQR